MDEFVNTTEWFWYCRKMQIHIHQEVFRFCAGGAKRERTEGMKRGLVFYNNATATRLKRKINITLARA
jgi:hypothetical protein